MMKRIFCLCIVLCFIIGVNQAFSIDNIPESFSKHNLIKYPDGGELYLAPNIISKKAAGKNEYADYEIVSFKIKNNIYGIVFDPGGPSEDPSFTVLILKNKKWGKIGTAFGNRLFISSSGGAYSEGKNNNFFNVRRKYKLTNSTFEEVKQAL